MGHRFEQRQEAELPASLEQVWAAITTGQGLDSWFMGHSEVRPGPGGTVRTTFGDYAPELSIAEWDPFRRFAYSSGEAQDGRCIAYEFLIEGRHGGSTVLRTVTSGFLPGDDWQDEYEAMTAGMQLYFRTLVEYLSYFAGRFATPITALGPDDVGSGPGGAAPRARPDRAGHPGRPGAGQPGWPRSDRRRCLFRQL